MHSSRPSYLFQQMLAVLSLLDAVVLPTQPPAPYSGALLSPFRPAASVARVPQLLALAQPSEEAKAVQKELEECLVEAKSDQVVLGSHVTSVAVEQAAS